jgi:long-subunit acyl-CoA synthetase (AMP-forming)
MTPEGLASILGMIQCTTLICAQETPSTSPGQQALVFPSLEEIIVPDYENFATYPYNETWEHAKDEISCIIHTSGTTGMSGNFNRPLPIYMQTR